MLPRMHICPLVFATLATISWAQTSMPTGTAEVPTPTAIIQDNDGNAQTDDDVASDNQVGSQGPSKKHSFFLAGLHFSETAEGSPGADPQVSSFSDVLASAHMLSIHQRSETAVDYLAGGDFYSGSSNYAVQQLNVQQSFLWRRSQITFLDQFGDLPGGTFGAQWFGGSGAYNLAVAGVNAVLAAPTNLSNFFSAGDFYGAGQLSRLTNVSLVQYSQSLTARSSVSVAGGYAFTSYSHNAAQPLINNHESGAQVSYSYRLDPKDQIGVSYGFQSFQFPQLGEGKVQTNVVQLVFSRQVSSRTSISGGVGPEFANLSGTGNGSANQINLSAYASLSYRLRRSSLGFSYDRLVTAGSGLFAGANTNTAQLSLTRPTRQWSLSFGVGYVRLSQLGHVLETTLAQNYQYGFAGAAVERALRPNLNAFASYQFTDQTSSGALCVVSGSCNLVGQGHSLTVGISLLSRPRRLE